MPVDHTTGIKQSGAISLGGSSNQKSSGANNDFAGSNICSEFLGHTAGAGAPFQDAWMTMLHAGNGGMCYIDSVELDEVYTPLHVHTRRLIKDSEGAGRFRGAPGIEVEISPVNCGMEAGFVADGNINVQDVVMIVSFILDSATPDPGQEYASDLNDDGILNVMDVVIIVSL